MTNKNHWYDGWFYDKFIAPNQDKLFGQIKNLIEPNSKVIDVGCGTGRFSFTVSDKCSSVVGIDISEKNVERANYTLKKYPSNKISFHHKSVNDILSEGKQHFDYAVITYVIHEVDERERINLLNDISKIAEKIIIGDYYVPRQQGFWCYLNEVVEFLAGSNHYKNFKSYVSANGIHSLAKSVELKVITEIKNTPATAHIVLLEK